MPSTDIAVRWRVRPGRGCRVCGWALLADMQRGRHAVDGHSTICRRCHAARTLARQHARRESGLCVQIGCPNERAARRGGLCNPCADARADRESVHRAADPDRYREYARTARASYPDRYREYARATRARYAGRTDEEIAAKRAELRPDGLKKCRKCTVRLTFDAFSADRSKADGLHSDCRSCDNAALLRAAAPRWSADDEYACVYCGAAFEHIDHVWPSADGGPDDARNLVPACEACNTSKRDAHVLDFIARRLGSDVVDAVLAWPVRYVDLDEELS